MCIQDPPAEPTERLGPNLLHVPREKDDIDVALHEGPTYGRVQVSRVRIGVTREVVASYASSSRSL